MPHGEDGTAIPGGRRSDARGYGATKTASGKDLKSGVLRSLGTSRRSRAGSARNIGNIGIKSDGKFRPPATGRALQLLVGELAGFAYRRGAGKHQVDGLRRLLHHPYLNALGQPLSELLRD